MVEGVDATDMHVHNQIVWDKVNPKLYAHKPDFNAQHELIAYGWRSGAAHEFHYTPESDQQWSTIWRCRRPQSEDMVHVNEKSVELVKNAVALSSSPDDIVIDLFVGGGSTIVACEQLGRKCRAIEIEPKYCAVTLERLLGMGLEPRRIAETNQA